MRYGDAKSTSAIVATDGLQVLSKRIEKVLRRKLKVKPVKETDLTKGDFAYFLPQIRPMWDTAWIVDRSTYVDIYNLYDAKCFDRVFRYCSSFEYETPSLSLSYPEVLIRLRSSKLRSGEKAVSIDCYNEIRQCDLQFINRSLELIRGVAESLDIVDCMSETESGFVFDPAEHSNRKIISRTSNNYSVNPESITLQVTSIPFAEVERLFDNLVKFLNRSFGEPKYLRLQNEVLHHEASERAKEVAKIDDRWDMEFFSEYRKGFDPFTRPAIVEYERMYPVVRHVSEPIENDFFLDLQVTVYHGPEESHLLLHTQRDQSFLQEIADEAGVAISEFGVKGYHGLEDLKI